MKGMRAFSIAVLGMVVFSVAFAADILPTLTVAPESFTYTQEEFSFQIPQQKGFMGDRYKFFIRELVESGEQKSPFRWVGSAEFARVIDSQHRANVNLLMLTKVKDTPEFAITSMLKIYAGNWSYRIASKTKGEISQDGEIATKATKEVYDLEGGEHRRRIVFGYIRINPSTVFFAVAHNYGLYSEKEPEEMIDYIFRSLRVNSLRASG